MLGFGHVIKQKFQNESAAEAAAFDFKVFESCGGVDVLDVFDSNKAGILHCVGKAIASLGCGRDADVVFAFFTEAFLAYVLVAFFAVVAADPTAFIAKEFDLLLLHVCERIQFVELLVESEIGNDIAEFVTVKLCFELLEIGDDFCG